MFNVLNHRANTVWVARTLSAKASWIGDAMTDSTRFSCGTNPGVPRIFLLLAPISVAYNNVGGSNRGQRQGITQSLDAPRLVAVPGNVEARIHSKSFRGQDNKYSV